jgi:hypothetical protein
MADADSEVTQSRVAEVGGLTVHRALPQRGRRTVGAWCFLDHFGPAEVGPSRTMTVGPHPHMGLHTVTWLLEGEVLHTDSLGNEQLIRPGELNLMTAGHGIAHAEDGRRQRDGTMEGIQFWVAQPEATRHGASSFAHHAELPHVDVHHGEAIVLLGEFDGARSPASVDSALVGLDISARGLLDLPLLPRFEHAVVVLRGELRHGGSVAGPNELVYFRSGRDQISLDLGGGARIVLLGGEPFESEIVMWWNFVGRDRQEMQDAVAAWSGRSARFGPVVTTLPRIEAPHPFWVN